MPALLVRFWPHLAIASIVIGSGLYLRHAGYEAGYAAREAYWRPKFDAAEKAKAEADARAESIEAASRALTNEYEARHAETVQALNTRAADADRRVRGLVRDLATRSRCLEVPSVSDSAALPDDAAEVGIRPHGPGERLVLMARGCEEDAAKLAQLQSWVTDQRAILNRE